MLIARPMGIIRFTVFFSAFLVSRIPLWFIIITAFFINSTVSAAYCITGITGIIICRSFIESEIAGGGFTFFTVTRILRGFAKVLSIVMFYGCVLFALYMFQKDYITFVLLLIAAIFLPVIINVPNKHKYYTGYYTPFLPAVITNILWVFIAFFETNIYMVVFTLITIYAIHFYNLYYNEPLKDLPNRETLISNS